MKLGINKKEIIRRGLKLFCVLHIIAVFMIVLFTFQNGCKDPNDYAPPEDSLLEPPDPPQLISPANDYTFMVQTFPFNMYIDLDWTAVDQAEVYEIEHTIDTFPPITDYSETNSWTIVIRDTYRLCDHYWRIRATSSNWVWWTDWSEKWHFDARWRPSAPQHIYPPDDTTFYVDSLPAVIEIRWDTLQDEEFYEVMIFEDTLLYDQIVVLSNSYTAHIYDTLRYSWQVRAGSSNWQYYSYWSNLWYFWVRRN